LILTIQPRVFGWLTLMQRKKALIDIRKIIKVI
jgi:hypothetical protein